MEFSPLREGFCQPRWICSPAMADFSACSGGFCDRQIILEKNTVIFKDFIPCKITEIDMYCISTDVKLHQNNNPK
jgi:hypothetical protein